MKHWLHKIEVFIDKTIPFLLVVLLAIIVGEIWFHEFMVKYHAFVQILDWIIVFFFVIDLIFKYIRIRNIPKFLRASWLDIIAVFPFFLVFRFFEGIVVFFGAGETAVTQAQKVAHLGIESEKEITRIVGEGERITKEISRSEKLAKFLRPLARGVRLTKLGNPDVREETKKDLKEVEKEGKIVLKDVEKEGKSFVKEVGEIPRVVKAAIFYEKPKIMKHISEKLNKPRKGIKRR